MSNQLPRGHAEWLARSDMTRNTWGWEPGKIFLGTLPDDPSVQVGRADDRHLVTLAGSRSGKSSTAILPNLKTWPGSVLCIDPKGELFRESRAWRERFGRVVVLDPFNVTGERDRDAWNPFDELAQLPEEQRPDEAALMAEALIQSESGGRDNYWADQSRNATRGTTLYLSLMRGSSLGGLRQLLSSPDDLMTVFEDMRTREDFDGVLAGLGATMLGLEPKERGSIISTALSQTGFLDSPGIRAVSDRSTFSLADFKEADPISVFLVLPSGRMGTHARWLRLFINMALSAMETLPGTPPSPVLWVLEEFAQLGHMATLASAAGYMAGFGVRLWLVLQDISQLKTHYRDGWETFLGNAGIVQAFGNTDPSTLEYLSKRMGTVDLEVVDLNPTNLASMQQGDTGERTRHDRRALLDPHEIAQIFSREKRTGLILAAGQKPLLVARVTADQLN